MATVSIKGLDKNMLLKKLWQNAKPASFFVVNNLPPEEWDDKAASKAVTNYVDYYCGRYIKCDLTGDEVSPRNYDRDYGAGAFAKVVDSLRATTK